MMIWALFVLASIINSDGETQQLLSMAQVLLPLGRQQCEMR